MLSPLVPESRRGGSPRGAGVTAVLGPTNTGKTHLAIERMLGHSSGIIGLPLRLLAREVYNKVAERAGADAVALITGEEKIKPANPRYWVSTVEAMPRDIDVAFLAVDEVQLAADLERGHVFTDRMLNYRGREETLVLGAQTVRPQVGRLLPGAHVITRPRLSQLSFAGEKKISRLPRRSAIVAFSAEEVYSIAEFIRRQRGGAAVVLGALSPRTRNAQVELYQSGDVEYLVATDAIGMGLNLDVDHVAFASDRKFDGYQFRRLSPAELAQIAGRAGRATRNGTFGTTGRCPPFDTELAQALEAHSFEPIRVLQWRNTALDFSSLGALQAALAQIPAENGLTRAPVAEDILVLEHAVRDDEIRSLAKTRQLIERLWEVCQIPDYRKISPATHAELVITLYRFLAREETIPTDWFARQVEQADRTDGDIDTLSNRIAHIRTWTFAANRPDWLGEPEHWQGVTREVEDKLSDALHERLTERFVDRRTSVLIRRLRENTVIEATISKSGEVVVEGHTIGRLDGFMFTPAASSAGSEGKALAGAAQKSLAGEINARATRLAQAPDGQLTLANNYTIRWLGQPVAILVAGDEPLKPRLRILCDEHLSGAPRDGVEARLDFWLKSHIERVLEPLFRLAAADDVTGMARGIAYQLIEGLGVLERQKVAEEIKSLDQGARATLRKYGVRFGAYHIYLPLLLKPAARVLATQLWALKHENRPEAKGAETIIDLAATGRTSINVDKDYAKTLYRVAGYRVCGARAIRVDILERLADLIRSALAWRSGAPGIKPPGAVEGFGFAVTVGMTSLAGCAGEDFASVLRSLGYQMEKRPKPMLSADSAEPAGARPQPVSPLPEPPAQPDLVETAEPGSAQHVAAPTFAGARAPETEERPADAPAPVDDVPVLPAATESTEAERPQTATEPLVAAMVTGCAEVAASGAQQVDTPDATEASPSTPAPIHPAALELIEVWRPIRRGAHARPRRARRPPSHEAAKMQVTNPEATRATATEAPSRATTDLSPPPGAGAPPAPKVNRKSRRRHHGSEESLDRAPQRRPFRAARAGRDHATESLEGRAFVPTERPRRESREARPDRDPELRARYIKGKGTSKEREPDPDSPFAKLAQLKEQLEANSKNSR